MGEYKQVIKMKLYRYNAHETDVSSMKEGWSKKNRTALFHGYCSIKEAYKNSFNPFLYSYGEPVMSEYDLEEEVFSDLKCKVFDKIDSSFIDYFSMIDRNTFISNGLDVLVAPVLSGIHARTIDEYNHNKMSMETAVNFIKSAPFTLECFIYSREALDYLNLVQSEQMFKSAEAFAV